MRISISSLTDVGKEREANEDAFINCPDLNIPSWDVATTKGFVSLGKCGCLTVVADGIGGSNAGDVASRIAMETVRQMFAPGDVEKAVETNTCRDLLSRTISEADQAICRHVERFPDTMGMGTTIVMAWLVQDKVHIAWCGDSRCYVYNPSKGLQLLSHDHSYVQQQVDEGKMTRQDAFFSSENNIITRGLGDCDIDNTPEFAEHRMMVGDVLLLCTDGLCGYCTDGQIAESLAAHYCDMDATCAQLLSKALAAGGYDNICISLLAYAEDDSVPKFHVPWWKRILSLFA